MIDSTELIDETKIAEFKELYDRVILENDGVFPRDKIIEELFCKMEDVALEMVCDWWSFSWSKGDLREIFDWYEERKDYIKLHPKTREQAEMILDEIKITLDKTQKERN